MKLLVDKVYTLSKMPGKGGWTFIVISEIGPEVKRHYGTVGATGQIDDYTLKQVNLMPMKTGDLFFPVKAEIRKHIQKEAGDQVRLVLYSIEEVVDTESDFKLCLSEEPKAQKNFEKLTKKDQKELLEWLSASRSEDERVNRMARAIDHLLLGSKPLDYRR